MICSLLAPVVKDMQCLPMETTNGYLYHDILIMIVTYYGSVKLHIMFLYVAAKLNRQS